MARNTDIEWADDTWNPLVGCSRVDHRCDACYAIDWVHRKLTVRHRGLTIVRDDAAKRPGPDWNGSVIMQKDKLDEPLRWRSTRTIFPCSLSDLFHPSVAKEYIAAIFGVMISAQRHTFMVLTKRLAVAQRFFAWLHDEAARAGADQTPEQIAWRKRVICVQYATEYGVAPRRLDGSPGPWLPPNIRFGVSISDQGTADKEMPLLAAIDAAFRWVSYEPVLGPVDWSPWFRPKPVIDLIIPGGESGPRARVCRVPWLVDTVQQAKAAGVATFMKQVGSRPAWNCARCDGTGFARSDDGSRNHFRCSYCDGSGIRRIYLQSYKGKDMREWAENGMEELCVRQIP